MNRCGDSSALWAQAAYFRDDDMDDWRGEAGYPKPKPRKPSIWDDHPLFWESCEGETMVEYVERIEKMLGIAPAKKTRRPKYDYLNSYITFTTSNKPEQLIAALRRLPQAFIAEKVREALEVTTVGEIVKQCDRCLQQNPRNDQRDCVSCIQAMNDSIATMQHLSSTELEQFRRTESEDSGGKTVEQILTEAAQRGSLEE